MSEYASSTRSRIALLKADDVDPALAGSFGELEDMFASMLNSKPEVHFHCDVFSVHKQEFPNNLKSYDGFLITGSRKSVYDSDSWIQRLLEFIQRLDAEKRKTVGICFGHQAIAQALGGTVARFVDGWGVGVHSYGIESSSLAQDIGSYQVQLPCCHQDQVTSLPDQAQRLLRSEFCENAGFRVGEHVLAFQPHPEFSNQYLECILRSLEPKIADRIERALASLVYATDNRSIARFIAEFFIDNSVIRGA